MSPSRRSPEVLEKNECDVKWALKIYDSYAALDVDGNGLLNRSELERYNQGSISKFLVKRVFEEYQTYSGEIDFKGFLDFVLALENKSSPSGLKYLFPLLDLRKKDVLFRKDIKYIFSFVHEILNERNLSQGYIDPEDVCDEIFDLVKPMHNAKIPGITLADLKTCKSTNLILGLLIDANDLWAYENRENLIAMQAQQE